MNIGEEKITMKVKRLIAISLATSIFLGTTGISAFAGEEIEMEDVDNDVCFESDDDLSVDLFDDGVMFDDEVRDSIIFEDDMEEDEAECMMIDMDSDWADGFDLVGEELSEEFCDPEETACDIEICDMESALNAEASDMDMTEQVWKALWTQENGMSRQVMIFQRTDGTWSDEQGNLFFMNEDGTWTSNGVLFRELTDDSMDDMMEIEMETDEDTPVSMTGRPDPVANAVVKKTKDAAQASINSYLDLMCRLDPTLVPLMVPFKLLIGEMFGINGSPDPTKVVLEKLDEIEAQLKTMESSLKEHFENVVSFDSIGGDFQKVRNAITPLRNKIGDISILFERGKIDETEMHRRLAELYYSHEYSYLMLALSGATNAYIGDTSYTIGPKSIFMAAYNLQCSNVMFSGEAVDCVTPYLIRQLCTYFEGWTLINTVLDSYELQNGTDATVRTRNDMFKNTGGIVNGSFDPDHPGVLALYADFFRTDRFTFVNKSSNKANHVRLSEELLVGFSIPESSLGNKGAVTGDDLLEKYTPQGIKEFPLNRDQMNNLADYVAGKHTTIMNYLLRTVGFKLVFCPNFLLYQVFRGQDLGSITQDSVVPFLNMTLLEVLQNGPTYIPTGAQVFTYTSETCWGRGSKSFAYDYMQAIKANKTGAKDEKLCIASNGDPGRSGTAVNANILFFMRA